MHLTICYGTGRKECLAKWFFQSLARELVSTPIDISIVIVDYWAESEGRMDYWAKCAEGVSIPYKVVPPKPTVWQGKHRLTSVDYFAAANTRNTALCHAPDGYICHVDDLSILMPGFLNAVKEAMDGGYIVFGAYKKMCKMVVEEGNLISHEPFAPGVDTRWKHGKEGAKIVAAGSWLYGCSMAAPVEALLKINGWDERCDCRGQGAEDYCTGIILERAGYPMFYDLRMLTYESEEHHHIEPPLKREIPVVPGKKDATHEMLAFVMNPNATVCPNYFDTGGIRVLREKILRGEPFPPCGIPEHCWYSGTPLREL